MVILYVLYFMYPLWFLGQLTTDDGVIFGVLFVIHSGYAGLFTVLAWFFNEPYSFVVNVLLIMLCLWVYNDIAI